MERTFWLLDGITSSAAKHRIRSYPDPFYFVEAEFLAPSVVQLCRARTGMIRHLRRLLQRSTVFQIRRDSGRPKAVIAELGRDAGCRRSAAYHRVGVPLGQGSARQQAGPAPDRRKQRSFGVPSEARAIDVGGEVGLKIVVARHGVRLAAFLAQPHPLATVLREHVLDLHAERRSDARERVDREDDERPVTQSSLGFDIDAVDELSNIAECRLGPTSNPI